MPSILSDFVEILARWFPQEVVLRDAIASVVLITMTLLGRKLALRTIQQATWTNDQTQLRWTVLSRRLAYALITMGLVVIWATALHNLAVSLVAFAAAMVLATKELILCVTGSIVRTSSTAYSVGDRIELDGTRGDVIDIGLLTTRVLEIGPGQRRTGRAVVIPHSLLLNKSVINETFTDDYVVHTVSVPVPEGEPWADAERRLLDVARGVCEPFIEDARTHMAESASRHGIPTFNLDPTATLQAQDGGKLKLLIRVPTPAREKGSTEQQILRGYLVERPPNGNDAGTEVPDAT